MTNKIFVTAVVDKVDFGFHKITKGKTYEVSNVCVLTDYCSGNIMTDHGHKAYILFDGLPCAWQNQHNWIVTRETN